MQFLYVLEKLRTPVLDTFFSGITHLGEEKLFLLLTVLVFWCISKAEDYYLMSVGFAGTIANQMLKILFRIPRPWVLDERFAIVESARAEATGYSFPSGHTQSAVGVFGGMARWNAKRAGKRVLHILCVALCVLVPLSRMYLGVHTPKDVGVSMLCALMLIFALHPVFAQMDEKPERVGRFLIGLAVVSVCALAFVMLHQFPADVDAVNLLSARDTLAKLTGAVLGVAIGYAIERRYVRFDTHAPLWGQACKVIIGVGLMLAFLSGLKPVMNALFGANPLRHALRYGVVVLFASCIWPMTFPWFSGKKAN